MTDLTTVTATELRKLYLDEKTTPLEVVDALFDKIDAIDPDVRAWAFIDKEIVYNQIKQIEALDKHALPMWGIPVGVKDIFNTYDMPTEMGSPIWKGFTPGNDARVVHYLRQNGAIILGKTHTAEFAVHYQNTTHNPHDLKRSPGTSSGGSAAAVAANMVPLSLGTQTAGSTGRPASYCGVYGMKPSFGIIPRIGVLKTTDSLDTIGFFSRSIDDLVLLFESCRVKGKNYEFVHKYIDNYVPEKNKVYKVGFVKHPYWDKSDTYAKTAIYEYLTTLKKVNNIEVVEISLPDDVSQIYDLHQTIYDKALAYYFKDEYEHYQLMSAIFYEIIQRGKMINSEQYQWALQQQFSLSRKYDKYFASIDIVITLTTAGIAPIGISSLDRPDSNLIWTFLGMPTVSMPLFKNSDGLPFGALFSAKKYDDMLLLDFLQLISKQHTGEHNDNK